MPEFKGPHRRFRALVSSYIGRDGPCYSFTLFRIIKGALLFLATIRYTRSMILHFFYYILPLIFWLLNLFQIPYAPGPLYI